jgi:tetratricopeptide (TPR) repeat protein
MSNEKNIVPDGGLLPQIRKENIGDIVKRLEAEWETLQLFQDAKKALEDLKFWELNLIVDDQESLKKATELGTRAAKYVKEIHAAIKEIKSKTHELDRAIGDYRKAKTIPFLDAKDTFANMVTGYREKSEEERREKIRLAEKAAREAAEAAKQKLLDEAASLEQEGHIGEAREVFEEIEDTHVGMIMPEGVENTTHTDSGKAIGREEVEVKVTDIGLLIKEIIAGRAPIGCINVSEGVLKNYIKIMRIEKMKGAHINWKKSTVFQGK